MSEKGEITVQTQHIFPVIKRWLYSDKDIFLREIVSNACDAITKLKHLVSIGQVSGIEEDYRVTVTVDKQAKTICVTDNGIGMSAEEVKKYINQIALSGALEFVEKYENNNDDNDGIIGHFGLGFYSAFMVSDTVELQTKSYTDAPAVKWIGSDEGEFELTDSDQTDRGTSVIMHITDEESAFLEKSTVLQILNKYCSFLPYPIYAVFTEDDKEKKESAESSDAEEKTEAKPINDTEPLWQKNPSQCTSEEYAEFYRKVFNDYREPLFHIHINADYPLNFKGILYFPRIGNAYDSLEGQVKLYYNRVFVADNIKEVIPEYLLMLKGVLDCPELPLNVSRSYLQSNTYVAKVSAHIVKKVCDKLNSLYDTDLEHYKEYWDDLKTFVKYACIRDHKFYEKVKNVVLYKTVDGEYVTLTDYLKTAREASDSEQKQENANEKIVYYTTDTTQQSVYINMFRSQGISVVVLDEMIDNNFITVLEQNEKNIRFMRIDSSADALKDADSSENTALKDLFVRVSKNDKLKVSFTALKDEKIPALLNIEEQSRRFAEMMKMYQTANKQPLQQFPEEATLVLNTSNALIKRLEQECSSDKASDTAEMMAKQIYTLALVGQRQLSAEELSEFLTNSFDILQKL